MVRGRPGHGLGRVHLLHEAQGLPRRRARQQDGPRRVRHGTHHRQGLREGPVRQGGAPDVPRHREGAGQVEARRLHRRVRQPGEGPRRREPRRRTPDLALRHVSRLRVRGRGGDAAHRHSRGAGLPEPGMRRSEAEGRCRRHGEAARKGPRRSSVRSKP